MKASDRPAFAAAIFRQIADAGINVTFSYVANGDRMIIGASDGARVGEILAKQARAIG